MFLSLLLAVGSASASDIRPGSACVPQFPSYDTYLYYSRLYSAESTPITVDCPIPRSTTMTSISGGLVWVVDADATRGNDVSCQFVSVNADGSVAVGSPVVTSAGGSLLILGAVVFPDTRSYAYLSCTLPARSATGADSAISSYSVTFSR